MDTDPNQMLTGKQVADLLALRPCTIAAWREDGSQPDLPFFKMGRAVRYRYADVVAYIERRRAQNTVVARAIVEANTAKVVELTPMRTPVGKRSVTTSIVEARTSAGDAVEPSRATAAKAKPSTPAASKRRPRSANSDGQQSLF